MEQACRYEVLPMTTGKYWYIDELAEDLRPQDREELCQLGVKDIRREILESVEASDEAYVAVDNRGKVIVMYGVIAKEPGGQIWCLGTRRFNGFKKTFVCGCMVVLRKWRRIYGTLWNYVARDNLLSIRWLRTYGAKFDKGYMTNGNEFWRFEIGGGKDV